MHYSFSSIGYKGFVITVIIAIKSNKHYSFIAHIILLITLLIITMPTIIATSIITVVLITIATLIIATPTL